MEIKATVKVVGNEDCPSAQKGWLFLLPPLLVGLVVKSSASRAADPGFESRLSRGDFSGSSHTSDLKLALQRLPYRAPGATGSAPRLVGPVSVYCDWVR